MANLVDLPMEVHQAIAGFLIADKDLLSFSQACKIIYIACLRGIWFHRFKQVFDDSGERSPILIGEIYKERRAFFKRYIHFDGGHTPEEKTAISIIWELILGCSFTFTA